MSPLIRLSACMALLLGCASALTAQNPQPIPPIFIDGNVTDGLYTAVGAKQNTNAGFGSAIDVSKIAAYVDTISSALYIGVVGKLDVTNSNGLGIWLNVAGPGSPVGTPAGTALATSSGGHYMGQMGNPNFKADFQVDYLFAFNPGSSSTTVYFDAVRRSGTPAAEYQGYCNQTGTTAADSNANGGVFSKNSVSFAFNNDGLADHGLELRIPFSEIGATKQSSFEVFAFIVSGTAYFADVTVPGNRTGGNPGFNADFSTMSGGPYHATIAALTDVEPGLNEEAAVPRTLALSNNFPNPFNPTSTIEFTVALDGPVTVKVYNALGQEVATVFDGAGTAGIVHRAQFNAANLPSGLYVARVVSGGQQAVRKLLCLK